MNTGMNIIAKSHQRITTALIQRRSLTHLNHIKKINHDIINFKGLQSNLLFNITADHLNHFFESVYLADPSVLPVVNFLKHHGLSQDQVHHVFKDHCAFRTPNIASGKTIIKGLIESGTYVYTPELKSNGSGHKKPAIQFTNIAGTRQVAVTLCATPKAVQNGCPTYCFLSMRDDQNVEPDLFNGLKQPFKSHPIIDPYWETGKALSDEYGALSPNHFTLSINELQKFGFKDIDDFRAHILKVPGCHENTALSIHDCPDVSQRALIGNKMYVEYLFRYQLTADTNRLVPGFSIKTENINRIGSHVSSPSQSEGPDCIIKKFRDALNNVAVIGAKALNEKWPQDLIASIKPYNADLNLVPNPVIYGHLNNEDDVRLLISWAKEHKAIIIPMGGNTNLVEAATFYPSPIISETQPILYVKYMDKSISYNDTSGILTVGPMAELHDVHSFLEPLNLRFPINFSAMNATLGGIASTNAGGEYNKFSSCHSYTDLICGDGIKRRLIPGKTQMDSMLPNEATALQGFFGIIVSVALKPEPAFKTTQSMLIEVPLDNITEFRSFVSENSHMVACELIDRKSYHNVTMNNVSGMMLLIQWANMEAQQMDQFLDALAKKYPDLCANAELSNSINQEKKLWKIRHDVSDQNRTWAKQNGMIYTGYDIAIPKADVSDILKKLNAFTQEKGGVAFNFGHSMQSKSHDTIHFNVALPKKLEPGELSTFIKTELSDFNVMMATEHGGWGHKSIVDTKNMITDNDLEIVMAQKKKLDPHNIFRSDLTVQK